MTKYDGRLIDPAGNPIAGGEVLVQYEQLDRTFHAHWMVTDADGRFSTMPHFPRQFNYRIMVQSKGKDIAASPWMTPAESEDRFPDFTVDRSRLTLQDVPPVSAVQGKSIRPAPR